MEAASKTKTYKISGDTRCLFYIKNEADMKGVIKFDVIGSNLVTYKSWKPIL